MENISKVRLHNMTLHTRALGPGTRAAIWFQGCKRRCKGCMSPLSRPLDGGKLVDVKQVVESVLALDDIEGITISGGEPFLQIDALYEILKSIRDQSDLGVIIYTGNTIAELSEKHNLKIDEITSGLADIIIDGEYVDDLNDGMALKGSSNQTVHFITGRYINDKDLYEAKKRNVEVKATNVEAFLVGIPDKDMLRDWMKISVSFSGEND